MEFESSLQRIFIEIHIIHSVSASRINRDRESKLKTIIFGGQKRVRLSAATQKRATRIFTRENQLLHKDHQAQRSRQLAKKVIELLGTTEFGQIELEQATLLTERAFAAIGMPLDKRQFNEYLIFHSEIELKAFCQAIFQCQDQLTHWEYSGSDKKKIKDSFPKEQQRLLASVFELQRNLELALYGRHLADLPLGKVDGEVMMMHAFSVHAMYDETDFFASIDDYAPNDEADAGMLKDLGIASPTFYRFSAINLGSLAQQIKSDELAKLGASAFIQSFVLGFPSGGNHSYFANTPPVYVLIQLVKNNPTNMAAAFERSIIAPRNRSMSEVAIEQLEKWVLKCQKRYPLLAPLHRSCINLTEFASQFDNDPEKSLEDIINEILKKA